jgi:DNA-binding beta-propeller fold protein YncE
MAIVRGCPAFAVAMLLATSTLVACHGSATNGAPDVLAFGSTHAAPAHDAYLYAADCCPLLRNGNIGVYQTDRSGPIERIFKGGASPVIVAFDRAGTLYAVDQWRAVYEYDSGSHAPSRRIDAWSVGSIALDASDNLYVAKCVECIPTAPKRDAASFDSVHVFAPKTTAPLRKITDGIFAPQSIAVDAEGNLYVSNWASKQSPAEITVYAPGSVKVSRRITHGITFPGPLAFDRTGNLFVVNARFPNGQILEYAPGSGSVLRRITDGITGPIALALDSAGTLYVDNWPESPSGPGWVSVYAPGSVHPLYRVLRGVNRSVAVALDSHDNLYVANIDGGGRISVYAKGAKVPLRYLTTGRFNAPRWLAFSPQP